MALSISTKLTDEDDAAEAAAAATIADKEGDIKNVNVFIHSIYLIA